MRTPVTNDPDVEKLLNESIRKSLRRHSSSLPSLLPGKKLDLLPGIDSRRLNQLLDDLSWKNPI